MRNLLQAIARLPQVRGSLSVKPIAGTSNELCLVRTDTGIRLPVAVVSDDEASGYAQLLSNAPVMLDLLAAVLVRWGKAVEDDTEIDGGDAVEWLSQFTTEVRDALRAIVGQEPPGTPQ